jgi:rfaE bifunctional protein kinase chain/domain
MTTAEILAGFSNLSALVVGDICLDRWCKYNPAASEPSRETGIPRIAVVESEVTPGGGGTVANNLASLRPRRVSVLGVRGEDGFGFELERALGERGISADLMVKVRNWQTFTYTKVLNSQTGEEDKPRLDFISMRPLPDVAETQIIGNLRSAFGAFDVVLVADQAETAAGGVVTPAVRECLIELAARHPEKMVLVDSRKRVHLFRNVTVKPNRDEAEAACTALFGSVDFPRLRQELRSKFIIVTHGPKGALVIEEGRETWSRSWPVEKPVDICGAGDSFAAGTALAMAVTRDPVISAGFGNLVASITVMKKGTGTASPEEVLAAEARRADSGNPGDAIVTA